MSENENEDKWETESDKELKRQNELLRNVYIDLKPMFIEEINKSNMSGCVKQGLLKFISSLYCMDDDPTKYNIVPEVCSDESIANVYKDIIMLSRKTDKYTLYPVRPITEKTKTIIYEWKTNHLEYEFHKNHPDTLIIVVISKAGNFASFNHHVIPNYIDSVFLSMIRLSKGEEYKKLKSEYDSMMSNHSW